MIHLHITYGWFVLQWQSCRAATETVWLAKSKIFTFSSFIDSWLRPLLELVLNQWLMLPPSSSSSLLPSLHWYTHIHILLKESQYWLEKREKKHGKADLNTFPRPSHLHMEHRARRLCISKCIFVGVGSMWGSMCLKWYFYAHITEGVWSTRMTQNFRLNWESHLLLSNPEPPSLV